MGQKICGGCGFENPSTRYFCGRCGKFLDGDEFNDPKIYALPEMKIMRIIDNLQHVPHHRVPWDQLTDYRVGRVETYKALFNLKGMGAEKNSALVDKIEDFFNMCHKPEFQIAFVGTIKTGKSTLINALLGKNYASMAVTPETAALTKFRASARDFIRVTFYDRKEWKKLWDSRTKAADAFMREYNELDGDRYKDQWIGHAPIYEEMPNDRIEENLIRWSSSKHAEHYFVKEIEVGISTLGRGFPPQVVFVDTPGLSDPVAYRSEITREYIRRANAVFVCIDAQKVYSEEIQTIASVFSFSAHDKNKVHIIATHWDTFNSPEKNWHEQKLYLEKQLTGKGFFDEPEMARENIMHSAAYIYNLCQNYPNLDEDDMTALNMFAFRYKMHNDLQNHLWELAEKTNVEHIKQIIRHKLADNYRQLLMRDIEIKYLDISRNLERAAHEKKSDAQELLKASMSDLDEINRKVEQKRREFEEVQSAINELSSVIRLVNKETHNRTQKICGTLRAKLIRAKLHGDAVKAKQ